MQDHRDKTRPTIGVFSYGFAGNFLWAGAIEAARQYDVNLIGFAGGSLHSPRGFEAQANILFDLVDPFLIDGLLLDSGVLSHYVGTNALHEFCGRYPNIPIVSSEVALKGIPSVLLDFYQGIRELIGHLIETHGCRRIAFIRGPQESQTAEERYHAYRKALSEYDIPFDPALIAPGTFFAPSGTDAIRLLLDERQVRFDAIAAANDWMALDAMQAMQARGIRVPGSVSNPGELQRQPPGGRGGEDQPPPRRSCGSARPFLHPPAPAPRLSPRMGSVRLSRSGFGSSELVPGQALPPG